jgi:RNA binding exosome subunit
MNEIEDLSDMEKSWETLLEQITPEGTDFKTVGIKPRKDDNYFNARVAGQQIIVDVAKMHKSSSHLKAERYVNFNQFKCVAGKYNRYVSGFKGVRPEMIDECGQNTSYLISLIYHLL